MSTLDIRNERDREIVNAIGDALKLLGADSMLQSAFNSIWENDHDMALEFMTQWNSNQRDRIAAIIDGYARFNWWGPSRPYSCNDEGRSQLVDPLLKTLQQSQSP